MLCSGNAAAENGLCSVSDLCQLQTSSLQASREKLLKNYSNSPMRGTATVMSEDEHSSSRLTLFPCPCVLHRSGDVILLSQRSALFRHKNLQRFPLAFHEFPQSLKSRERHMLQSNYLIHPESRHLNSWSTPQASEGGSSHNLSSQSHNKILQTASTAAINVSVCKTSPASHKHPKSTPLISTNDAPNGSNVRQMRA